ERVPQRALGIGWVAAKEPRKPAHRTERGRRAALPVLGEKRAQRGGFLTVEHPTTRRSLAAFAQRVDDAVQRLYVLLGGLHAREDVAQIDQHGRTLLERTEIFDHIELALEMGEERLHLLLAGGRRFLRHGERQRAGAAELEPFV